MARFSKFSNMSTQQLPELYFNECTCCTLGDSGRYKDYVLCWPVDASPGDRLSGNLGQDLEYDMVDSDSLEGSESISAEFETAGRFPRARRARSASKKGDQCVLS